MGKFTGIKCIARHVSESGEEKRLLYEHFAYAMVHMNRSVVEGRG
jgi:hypothetical protein